MTRKAHPLPRGADDVWGTGRTGGLWADIASHGHPQRRSRVHVALLGAG